MSNSEKEKHLGLAGLFSRAQLKYYFLNYIYFIIAVEILIFVISFLGNLGPDKSHFPWKFYFYISFSVPIAITFLLGVFVAAFNHFIFTKNQRADGRREAEKDEDGESEENLTPRQHLSYANSQLGFLFILFLFFIASLVIYKIDGIVHFVANAGEMVIEYLLISGALALLSITLIALVWLVMNYRLHKKRIEEDYHYKRDVMQSLGLLILDDSTVIDREGKIVTKQPAKLIEMHKPQNANVRIFSSSPKIANDGGDSQ
jgi:hypothetical protein